jgi:hypothetical protein
MDTIHLGTSSIKLLYIKLGILFVIVLFEIDLVRCALIGYSTSAPTTKCPPNASLNKLLASTPALILSMYYYSILTLIKK